MTESRLLDHARPNRRSLLKSAALGSVAALAAPYVKDSFAAGSLALGVWDHWVPGANNALIKLCTEDRWSAPMLSCLDAATDSTAAKACASKLSQSQLARLNKLLSELSGLPIGTAPQQTSSPQTSSGNQTTGEAR